MAARVRVYPEERAPSGLSLAALGGATRFVRERADGADPALPEERARVVPMAGFSLDQNWCFGRRQQYLLGTGFTWMRRFTGDQEPGYDAIQEDRQVWRVVVGYAW